jgi:hypothetical protein
LGYEGRFKRSTWRAKVAYGLFGSFEVFSSDVRYCLNADIRLRCNICRTGRLQVTAKNAERA